MIGITNEVAETAAVLWLVAVSCGLSWFAIKFTSRDFWKGVAIGAVAVLVAVLTGLALGVVLFGGPFK